MEEETKAVKEVATTVGKAIDAMAQAGQFFAKFFTGPLEQASGIVEDRLRFMRLERYMRLKERAVEILRQREISGPTRAVPLSILVRILEFGSMEEDNDLQDLWAQLLVTAGDAKSGIVVEPAFIGILQNLSSRDAAILDKIYSFPMEYEKLGLYTYALPEKLVTDNPTVEMNPPKDVCQSLGNLNRLGLIASGMMWDAGSNYQLVSQTVLGRAFVTACRGTSS
ncbi:MAG: DUF4393 domain-containing protein [Nitrospira sp.]|nr:DUF4393 domain-containing protein [Nitrospira sp.]